MVSVTAVPLPSWPDRAVVVSRRVRATFLDAEDAVGYLEGPAARAARMYLEWLEDRDG